MSSALGLVPLVGCEPLALEPFGSAPLYVAAVDALYAVLGAPVHLVTATPPPPRLLAGRDRPVRFSTVTVDAVVALVRIAAGQGTVVLVHDPLCPLVPASFFADLLQRARKGQTVAAVGPVVDTIKSIHAGAVVATVDRDTARVVSSPVALPASRLVQLPDLAAALLGRDCLVRALRAVGEVELVMAPSAGRPVEDRSALELLAADDAVGHRLRER